MPSVNSSILEEIFETISEGYEGNLPKLIGTIFNEAMKIEREKYLNAPLYGRKKGRISHANG